MLRPALLALVSLGFGVAAVLLPDRLFPPDDNYRTLSAVEEAFRGVLLGSIRFVVGGLAGFGLAAALLPQGGGGGRRSVALVVTALFALAAVGLSGPAFRGMTRFPGGGSLEERHRWAEARLGRPYREAVAWAASAPAVREACGGSARFGPAEGGRNVVRVGSAEWSSTLTLDVEGERGAARLALETRLPLKPEDSRPVVLEAVLEAEGRRVRLDRTGSAGGP